MNVFGETETLCFKISHFETLLIIQLGGKWYYMTLMTSPPQSFHPNSMQFEPLPLPPNPTFTFTPHPYAELLPLPII